MTKQNQQNSDLQEATEFDVMAKSSVGRKIVKGLDEEISEIMDGFIAALDRPDLNRFISLACQLKSSVELKRRFTGASETKRIIEESIQNEGIEA